MKRVAGIPEAALLTNGFSGLHGSPLFLEQQVGGGMKPVGVDGEDGVMWAVVAFAVVLVGLGVGRAVARRRGARRGVEIV